MKITIPLLFILVFADTPDRPVPAKIFDVHLHGTSTPVSQLATLKKAGVYKIAVSTSWELQQTYKTEESLGVYRGLMVPCPGGKVPYSLQTCYANGATWPDLTWVEENIRQGNIHFIGEVLAQYHGVSSSEENLLPYYALAKKYNIPVGIHTGSAGPDHGCPDFSEEMGNPELMRPMLTQFPGLKVWIMHAGAPYVDETIAIMKDFPNVYLDISAINFPPIMPKQVFSALMEKLIDEQLEDRIMFGSDNNDIHVTLSAINDLTFLSHEQKEKIFFRNAERFFGK